MLSAVNYDLAVDLVLVPAKCRLFFGFQGPKCLSQDCPVVLIRRSVRYKTEPLYRVVLYFANAVLRLVRRLHYLSQALYVYSQQQLKTFRLDVMAATITSSPLAVGNRPKRVIL